MTEETQTPETPTPEPSGDVAPADVAPDAPEPTAETDRDQMVPVWLAALILVLLLAVMAVGGYALRGALTRHPAAGTAEELAVQKAEDAVKLAPDDTDARMELAFAYQQAKRYEEALKQYDLVLDASPRNTAALYNKGLVYMAMGESKQAESMWWDVLGADPEHVLAAKSLGEYYASKKQYRSLIEAVRPVVEAKESSADLQYLMGLAYENLGRADWARARYGLALKYYPDMQEAKEGLERLGVAQ